jgi:hypothetical protein
MGSLSLYDVVIPTFIHGLQSFNIIISKAEEYANEESLHANDFVSASLIADQLPLAFQVFNAARIAAKIGAFLSGTEPVAVANTDKTVADLHTRIQTVLALLEKVDPATARVHEDDEYDL